MGEETAGSSASIPGRRRRTPRPQPPQPALDHGHESLPDLPGAPPSSWRGPEAQPHPCPKLGAAPRAKEPARASAAGGSAISASRWTSSSQRAAEERDCQQLKQLALLCDRHPTRSSARTLAGPIYGCMEWFYVLAALLAALGPFMSGLAAVFALKKGPGVNSALLKKSSAGQVVPPFAECLSLKRLQCFAFRNLPLQKSAGLTFCQMATF